MQKGRSGKELLSVTIPRRMINDAETKEPTDDSTITMSHGAASASAREPVPILSKTPTCVVLVSDRDGISMQPC